MGQRTGQQWMRRRKVRGSKPRSITGRKKGGSPQQCLDHLPTWLWLIFTPCRQSSSCQLITLEQAENAAGLGLLFLLLALHEFCNQLLMSLPSHSLFLSPVIVITRSPEFVLPSLASSALPPCMQWAWEMPMKHTQSLLCLSPAAFPMQNEIIPHKEEALCTWVAGQGWGFLSSRQTGALQPYSLTAQRHQRQTAARKGG